jgi:hypothetical protein
MHVIKVFLDNKDYFTTKINGTFDDIVKHYRNFNYFNNAKVTKIEFLESELLKKYSSLKYLFIDGV